MAAAVQNCEIGSRARSRPSAARSRMNYWVDMVAFSTGILAFVTGLLLLTRFHVADGALRGSELGLSRLAWVNIHRFGAATLLVAIAMHVQVHWRTVVVRTKRAWRKLPGAAKPSDLVLYAGFLPMSATALTAWFLAPGSPPVFGPVTLNHLAPERHVWIDLHNFSGLILLPAVILHVRRHVRWMCHTSGTGRR